MWMWVVVFGVQGLVLIILWLVCSWGVFHMNLEVHSLQFDDFASGAMGGSSSNLNICCNTFNGVNKFLENQMYLLWARINRQLRSLTKFWTANCICFILPVSCSSCTTLCLTSSSFLNSSVSCITLSSSHCTASIFFFTSSSILHISASFSLISSSLFLASSFYLALSYLSSSIFLVSSPANCWILSSVFSSSLSASFLYSLHFNQESLEHLLMMNRP